MWIGGGLVKSTISSYHLDSELGKGATGTVYLAHKAGTEPSVAIKVLASPLATDPEYRQRIAEALCKGVASYANSLSHFQVAQKSESGTGNEPEF